MQNTHQRGTAEIAFACSTTKERVILSLILTAVVVTLSGCNNPKAANKENFAKPIKQRIAENPHRLPNSGIGSGSCTLDLRGLPVELRSIDYGSNQLAKGYEALKSAGLMTSKVVKEENSWISGKIITTKYDLSENGKQMLQSLGNNTSFLPYCQVAFKDIKSFSAPEGEKTKLAYVEYTYVVEQVDDWAKNPAILQQFPNIKQIVNLIGQPREAQMYLVLTKDGWAYSHGM